MPLGRLSISFANRGSYPDQNEKIEPQTLKAWVREMMEQARSSHLTSLGPTQASRRKSNVHNLKRKTNHEPSSKENRNKEQCRVVDSSMFEADAHDGMENITSDDVALPFLKVLAQLSPELETIDGAKAGMIYNTVTGDLYDGQKGIMVVPCHYERKYIEWHPRGSGNGAPANIYGATSDIMTKTFRNPVIQKITWKTVITSKPLLSTMYWSWTSRATTTLR
jgi:hypothetical protein